MIIALEALLPGRRLGMKFARRAAAFLLRVFGIRVSVVGEDNIPSGPRVYVANHRSHLDSLVLLASCPDGPRFAAAAGLWRLHRLAARTLDALAIIPVDRKNPHGGIHTLRSRTDATEGGGLVTFPEGTVGTSHPLGRFRSGPFMVAIESQCPVVPIAIHNSSRLMPPDAPYAFTFSSINPGRVIIEILEPIPTEGLTPRDRRALIRHARRALLDTLRLQDGGSAARPDLGLPPEGR